MAKSKIKVKTKREIEIMKEGGKKLSNIKTKLSKAIKGETDAAEIEKMANKLIEEAGGKPSFKMVAGYSWATCINVNEGVVHGIPKKETIFSKGDIVSVDVGMFYKGFHTDTSFTVGISPSKETTFFLMSGKKALEAAIKQADLGSRVFDISKAIQVSIENSGFTPVRALVGHGIGRDLHEEPQIPCFVKGARNRSPLLPEGAVLAIEVMYTKGTPSVTVVDDGWTIETSDGKIAGLFEETVAVTGNGPLVLTTN